PAPCGLAGAGGDRPGAHAARPGAGQPCLGERENLLRSVPGIGATTAFTLWAQLPELGQRNHKALAPLVGGAPLNRDSGTLRGKRGGWARVRSALYMAALVATRHHAVIRAFSRRLCAEGKPKQLALTACMHKLLTILNALVRPATPWLDCLAPA